MTQADVIRMAREDGIDAMIGATRDGKYEPKVNALKSSVPVEWLERFAALVAAQAASANPWMLAVDAELVSAHLGVAKPDGEARRLLGELIQWHVDVALDPRVSAAARSLQEDSAADERKKCIIDAKNAVALLPMHERWSMDFVHEAITDKINARAREQALRNVADLTKQIGQEL